MKESILKAEKTLKEVHFKMSIGAKRILIAMYIFVAVVIYSSTAFAGRYLIPGESDYYSIIELKKAEPMAVIEGEGFLLAMKTFDRTRNGVGSLALGAARTAYETSKEWAKNRIQFGKPIAANQAIAFMLADMEVMIETSRLLIWRSAKAYENGLKEASKLSAMAKLYASDSAMKIATDAVQIMGGDGYTHEFMVEKIMRDVKLTQIYEGTNQVQRVVISKSILKG